MSLELKLAMTRLKGWKIKKNNKNKDVVDK